MNGPHVPIDGLAMLAMAALILAGVAMCFAYSLHRRVRKLEAFDAECTDDLDHGDAGGSRIPDEWRTKDDDRPARQAPAGGSRPRPDTPIRKS